MRSPLFLAVFAGLVTVPVITGSSVIDSSSETINASLSASVMPAEPDGLLANWSAPPPLALLQPGSESLVGVPGAANLASPPSSARGPEVTTVQEALEAAALPAVNAPPVTRLSTTTTTAAPQPTTPATQAPRTAAERRGHAALAQISYDWQAILPQWTFIFSSGRSGVLGYTYVDRQTIEIFVRDSMSDALLAHVVAHELGHAVDVTLNSGDDRRRWQEARGISTARWWPGNGVSDFSTGAGDFAESFAAWQVGNGNFRSNLAGPPNSSQRSLLAELSAG